MEYIKEDLDLYRSICANNSNTIINSKGIYYEIY